MTPAPLSPPSAIGVAGIRTTWQAAWPEALATWSRFTRLREPVWCPTPEDAAQEGLTGSFAMIRLTDQAVVVSLAPIGELHLEGFAREILAHEIGHHVYCPADLTDHARMLARMRPALPTKEAAGPMVANLYADLLINDRLQRSRGLRLASVYERLAGATDPLWTLYMRTYEILWSLAKGTLAKGEIDDRLQGDAHLGARLVRAYAADWLGGAGRFAALCLPYLLGDGSPELRRALDAFGDLRAPGRGGAVTGLTEVEGDERDGALHPSLDPALSGLEPDGAQDEPAGDTLENEVPRGQYREPFEYGEILRELGMDLDDHEVAVRYYRERATPSLIPFPHQETPPVSDPLPEGLETWEIGAPLEDADWVQSVIASPRVIPGVTTVQRQWGQAEGGAPRREPLDLDLYVDSSGSMPNPQVTTSYVALAGVIVALSALRAGGRVQATLWSGARQFVTTGGFVSDPTAILKVITDHIGGGTAFPIHVLRDTYAARSPRDRPVHILVVSDDGVTTMFDADERGNSGWDVARDALEKARGGGTLALNVGDDWERDADLGRARDEGWRVRRVRSWEDLTAFARDFSRLTFGERRAAR